MIVVHLDRLARELLETSSLNEEAVGGQQRESQPTRKSGRRQTKEVSTPA
jgi:hypothetical protein